MTAIEVDTTRLPLLLQELRLPAVARLWPEFTERSDKEGWPAARLLSVLAELEIAERGRRPMTRLDQNSDIGFRHFQIGRRVNAAAEKKCRISTGW